MNRLRRLLLASALGCLAFAPSAAFACNPLEFLFGGCREAPVRAEAPAPENSVPVKKKPRVHAAKAPAKKQAPLATPDGVAVGSIAHFSGDPTLRPGDVVATPKGFMVYRGGANGASGDDKFAPLDPRRGVLKDLENASLRKGGADAGVSPLAVSEQAQRNANVRHIDGDRPDGVTQ